MDYKTIMGEKYHKSVAEVARLEVELEKVKSALNLEIARTTVYAELIDEFSKEEPNTEEIIDLCDETTDTSYNV